MKNTNLQASLLASQNLTAESRLIFRGGCDKIKTILPEILEAKLKPTDKEAIRDSAKLKCEGLLDDVETNFEEWSQDFKVKIESRLKKKESSLGMMKDALSRKNEEGEIKSARANLNSLEFMKALYKLNQNNIDVDESFFQLTSDKALDKNYLDPLIKLKKGGVTISGFSIFILTPERVKNKDFINNLLKLSKKGVNVDEQKIDDIAIDFDYKNAIPKLIANGIMVDKEMAAAFLEAPAKTLDIYLDALIELNEKGIKVDGLLVECLSSHKVLEKNYIKTLIKFNEKRIDVNGGFLSLFSRYSKVSNLANILIEFNKKGFKAHTTLSEIAFNSAYSAAFEKLLVKINNGTISMEDIAKNAKLEDIQNAEALEKFLGRMK